MAKVKDAGKKPGKQVAATTSKAQATRTPPGAAGKQVIASMDLERIVELDFMRTTEAAALNAYQWLGKGDPQAAHAAAVDAMRGALDLTNVSARAVFGDGVNPRAGGIEVGEKLGRWEANSLEMELATVPIDGVNLVARGLWGAMAVLVAAQKLNGKSPLLHIPCRYVMKIAYGPRVKNGLGQAHLDASVRDNLEIIAGQVGKRVRDLTVAVLDRERHETLIEDIRKAGASVRLFSDGDVAAAIAPSLADTGFDVYMGTGGSAEAVMAAAAIKCLDGDILVRPLPQSDQEKQAVVKALGDKSLKAMYHAGDLARGDRVTFCATGVSDGSVLRGVHVDGCFARTSSVVMRTRHNTVRMVTAQHNLSKKTIRLRTAAGEAKL